MDEAYLSPPVASDVSKLFQITIPRDGLTAYDVLGLPENADDAALATAIDQRQQLLARCADDYQRRGDGDSCARIGHLQSVLTNLTRSLASGGARKAYDRLLEQTRKRRFQQAVTPLLVPGREPTPDENEHLLCMADDFRLERQSAGQFVLQLLGLNRSGNEYSRLGVVKFANDPTWPTWYDLLLLAEDIADPGTIRAQHSKQMAKVEKIKQSPEQDDKRLARSLEERFNEAVATLLDATRRRAYLKDLHEKRVQKFREEVVLYVPRGSFPDVDTVLQLIDLGQALRMPEDLVRDEIKKLTGFSDFMGLIAERKRPLLGLQGTLAFHVDDPVDEKQLCQEFTMNNDGADTLKGTVRSTEDWITVTPSVLETAGSQTFTVRIDPDQLKPGIPSVASIEVSSNGGMRAVTVSAMLADTGTTSDTKEKVPAAIAYAAGGFTLGIVPIVIFFMYERKSVYVATQAAQASVLYVANGIAFFALTLFGGLCFCLSGPIMFLNIAMMFSGLLLCIPAALGQRLRLPYVFDYAQRFLRQRVVKK